MTNLKQSEKILLSVLLVAVVFFLFVNILFPKFSEIKSLNKQIETISNEINKIEQDNKINGTDNSKTSEEKELDNKLLTYKNNYFIENFSQNTIIVKLNEFSGADSSVVSGFKIENVNFEKYEPVETEEDEEQDTQSSDQTTEEDTNADNTETDTKDTEVDSDAETDTESNTDGSKDETKDTAETKTAEVKEPLNFADIDPETINPDAIDYYLATVDFISDYDGVTNYVKNVENYSKAVLIKSVTLEPVVQNSVISDVEDKEASTNGFVFVDSDGYVKDVPDSMFTENGTIKGTIQLLFINFKVYGDDENLEYTDPAFDNDNTVLEAVENPFKPFENFIHYKEPQAEETDTSNNFSSGNFDIPQEEKQKLAYRTIYGFETKQFFFSSSPASAKGTASLSPLSISGKYSGKLTYNFTKGVENNTASYVFDSNSILVSEKPYSIGLKVYELTEMPYNLGITIKDSSGKSYDVLLTKNVDENSSWANYETTELPTLTYPCIVKRVFVTTSDLEKTQLQGELLLDNLEVSKEVK